MKAIGVGVKAGLSIARYGVNDKSKFETMYRACWVQHARRRKSYHIFSIRRRLGQSVAAEDLVCPKCGRMSRPAPPWVRSHVFRGIVVGQEVGKMLSAGMKGPQIGIALKASRLPGALAKARRHIKDRAK